MADDTVLCGGCGITLRPFMTSCPRCGAVRQAGAAPKPAADVEVLRLPRAAAPASPPASKTTTVVPLDELRRRSLQQEDAAPAPNTVVMSPPDEVRRFPLFTRAQIILLLVGLGLLGLGLLIGYLLWSRERTDSSVTLSAPPVVAPPAPAASLLPAASPTLDPIASPTPALSVDDQTLFEEAKKVLAAYNPNGFARYKFTVKDGVITLNGTAEHQPEKEGATNVLRLLAGAKQVVNNLIVKTELPTLPAQPTPAGAAASLNFPLPGAAAQPTPTVNQQAEQETERLRRELEAARQREAEAQRQREAEQQRQREAEAQRQRDAEAQRQRDAEAQRQRDAAEAARRQQQEEETRRVEATRPRRAETSGLRSGTVAWSGIVDGVDEIVIGGGSAAVRHLSGEVVRDARASFSVAVPRAPVSVKLLSTNGRGTLQIVQQPAAENGYTTIVRIDDSGQRGGQPHQFTLRWTLP